MDVDKSGGIDKGELRNGLKTLGIEVGPPHHTASYKSIVWPILSKKQVEYP
jgi:hypothetical protein